MRRNPNRPAKPVADDFHKATWLHSLPLPEVHEGGESSWELWHEAARQLETAFAPTQPSEPAPLSTGTPRGPAAREGGDVAPLSADALMLLARRYNRVCPRPLAWLQLYEAIDGSDYVDLPRPPVDPWLWGKLSDLQKRLRFRECIHWAEQHGKLPQVSRFMEQLAEADWLHMGEG